MVAGKGMLKGAELASSLGAIALGAGLGLLLPTTLQALAVPVLVIGILVHGAGMSIKHRLETRLMSPLWWETTLFWLCWIALGGLAVWLTAQLAGHP